MPDLNNKIALITGGTSGIGLGTASEFLKAGAEVVTITADATIEVKRHYVYSMIAERYMLCVMLHQKMT